MAGGADWRLISKSDSADFYQKVEGGPWYMRKGVTFVIRTKVAAGSIDLGAGDQGDTTGIIMVGIGGATKSRNFTDQLVCKSDSLDDLGEGHTYMQRTQVWEWKSSDEEEVFSAS